MSKPIKRVLLTNDDGWRGPGMKILEDIAHQIAE
ncbi:MAG: 5'/3'-nucleotidase SurE, partial [Pseudomonas sp.]|nr:5'/3'-nucleotidase SurE [Pseudomonas sp.]